MFVINVEKAFCYSNGVLLITLTADVNPQPHRLPSPRASLPTIPISSLNENMKQLTSEIRTFVPSRQGSPEKTLQTSCNLFWLRTANINQLKIQTASNPSTLIVRNHSVSLNRIKRFSRVDVWAPSYRVKSSHDVWSDFHSRNYATLSAVSILRVVREDGI